MMLLSIVRIAVRSRRFDAKVAISSLPKISCKPKRKKTKAHNIFISPSYVWGISIICSRLNNKSITGIIIIATASMFAAVTELKYLFADAISPLAYAMVIYRFARLLIATVNTVT